MGSLKFVCSKDATSDADFRIEYYNPKNWNDYGYFTRYRLFAESSITGGGEILVGTIKISSIGQQQGIEDHLSSVMGETPFEKIDDTFYSEIFEENVARKVFVLLTPEQRTNLIDALNLNAILDYEVFQKARRFPPIGCGLFRTNCTRDYFRTLYNRVAKYLLSEIDYKSLPRL